MEDVQMSDEVKADILDREMKMAGASMLDLVKPSLKRMHKIIEQFEGDPTNESGGGHMAVTILLSMEVTSLEQSMSRVVKDLQRRTADLT